MTRARGHRNQGHAIQMRRSESQNCVVRALSPSYILNPVLGHLETNTGSLCGVRSGAGLRTRTCQCHAEATSSVNAAVRTWQWVDPLRGCAELCQRWRHEYIWSPRAAGYTPCMS